jgi:tetratricopeptide (TPR) repeat protein
MAVPKDVSVPAELSAEALAAAIDDAGARGKWPEAEALAERLIKAFPDDPEGPARLREALQRQGLGDGDVGQRVKNARKAAKNNQLVELYGRARLLREAGKPAEALAAYLDVFACEPRNSTASPVVKSLKPAFDLATALEDWPTAQAVAERRVAAFPADPEAREQLARTLERQGLSGQAAAAAVRAEHLRGAAEPAQLTILTVVLEQHYGYIAQQLELIEALNPATPFKLLVVDNSGPGEPGLKVQHPRCEVIAGVEADPSLPEQSRGSYHHAAALNLALGRVQTPWLLVLDPDFFVVYRNWIQEVQDHMLKRRLSLFGAPWHYAWNRKWRYFPCVHFLMIDLGRIGLEDLDFTPALIGDAESSSSPAHQWMQQHAPILRNRLLLESRRDTGWRLHERFRDKGVADVALPVVDTRTEFRSPERLQTPFGRWLELKLPRRRSFLPAPGTYVESDQAASFRRPSIKSLAPEKFVWRGAPFAVHLRGNMREDMRTSANPRYKERAATKELLDAVAGASSWAEWAFGIAVQD